MKRYYPDEGRKLVKKILKSPIARLFSISLAAVFPGTALAEIPNVDLELNEAGYLDFSAMASEVAFAHLAYALQVSYPLSDWKVIDWDARYDSLRPEVEAAIANNDEAAYFRLVRSLALSAHDGHVSVASEAFGAFPFFPSQGLDGFAVDFGFKVLALDDGRFTALVQESGAAWDAGMRSGAILQSIDGLPPAEKLAQDDLAWLNLGVATADAAAVYRGVAVGYGETGAGRTLVFINPGATAAETVVLQGRSTSAVQYLRHEGGWSDDELFDYGKIDETTGYLRLRALITEELLLNLTEETYVAFLDDMEAAFGDALAELTAEGAETLVLDLRGNTGGLDPLGSRLAGYFVSEEAVYSVLLPFVDEVDGWDPAVFELETVTPQVPVFAGRVALLADYRTISAGEGLVRFLATQPQVRYVGFWGTAGSYAETGGVAVLPGDIVVTWPIAPHVDIDGEIQIDAGPDGRARVSPDLRIPHTLENLITLATADSSGGSDLELEWAVAALNDPFFGFFPTNSWQPEGSKWIFYEGIGWIWPHSSHWAYHFELGWLYLSGRGGDSFQVYSAASGWCWSGRAVLPYYYASGAGWSTWLQP